MGSRGWWAGGFGVTDHEPHSAERLALEEKEKEDPKAAAFRRWRLYLEQREREKAEERKSA